MGGVIVHPVGGLGEWVTSPVPSLIELTHLDSDVTVPGVLTQRAGDVIVTIVTSPVVFVLCWWLRTTLAVGVAAFFLFRNDFGGRIFWRSVADLSCIWIR